MSAKEHRGGRACHLLVPLKTAHFPRYVAFVAVEQKPLAGGPAAPIALRLGWVGLRRYRASGRPSTQFVEFKGADGFWSALESFGDKRRRLWCVVHDLVSTFWLLHGFEELIVRGYHLRMVYSRGKRHIITARRDKRTLIMVDVSNYLSGDLAELGAMIDLPRVLADVKRPTRRDASARCLRDAEIVAGVFGRWADLLKDHRLGGLAYTVGGQAMQAFRYRFLDHPIYVHDNQPVTRLERQAYHGGRVECRFIGDRNTDTYKMLDFNSLYPFVMREHPYPFRLLYHFRRGTVDELYDNLDKYAVVAAVRVETGVPCVPRKDGSSLTFPIGRFKAYLTGPELRLLREYGHVLKVYEVALYEQGYIFQQYVDCMTDLRRQFRSSAQPLLEKAVKVLANSLYGKWGQRGEKWAEIENVDGFPPGPVLITFDDSSETHPAVCLGPVIWYCKTRGEGYHSFPAIAAYVSAYARVELWRVIERAGPDHVLYCDTDSVLVDSTGAERLENLVDPAIAGRLKVEAEGGSVQIRGPKDYTFAGRRVLKGVTADAEEITPGVFRDIHNPGILQAVGDSPAGVYRPHTVTMHLRREYGVGRIRSDGRVEPHQIGKIEPDVRPLPF